MGCSDGGYVVSDFRKVPPELGTMEDLPAMAADCHERGINLCLDFVMNHASEDHKWAKRARPGEKEYYIQATDAELYKAVAGAYAAQTPGRAV